MSAGSTKATARSTVSRPTRPPRPFGELRHHGGTSPAWPISYEELERYYTQAEQLYQVHGTRGEDPTEPPASAPYPFPAVTHEPRIQQLSDDLAKAGLHPFHAPCGVMLDESNMPYSKCVRCDNCDGFPCLVHAKSDAEVIAVRPAIEHPNVTLLINAEAVRLETNGTGTAVTGVVVNCSGERETFEAPIIVVSCGAANSARLLLASANDRHPSGLANGSDQLGRNFMFHNSQAVLALSKEENPSRRMSARRESGRGVGEMLVAAAKQDCRHSFSPPEHRRWIAVTRLLVDA